MKRIIGILALTLCMVTSIGATQAEGQNEEKVDATGRRDSGWGSSAGGLRR